MALTFLSIIAKVLNFIGAISLSAGLLRSKEQIKDEEATYWDSNPYKTKGALRTQPFYRNGLRLMVAGFSGELALSLNELFRFQDSLIVTTTLSIAFLSVGIFFIQWFENRNSIIHQDLKTSIKSNQYKNHVNNFFFEAKALLVDHQKDETKFEALKQKCKKTLESNNNNLSDDLVVNAETLVNRVSESSNIEALYFALEEYKKVS